MNCSNCNTLIPPEASFCPGCGTPVEKEETPCVKKQKCNVWIFISVFAAIFVVVIIFAALLSSSSDEDKIARLVMDIKQLDYALQQYKLDVGTYPSDLHCLLENIDQSDKWSGPYLLSEIPRDPWGSEYQYIIPGEYDEFDLYSFGADKREGGNGINADFSKHPGGLHYPFLPDWRERMIAESKGQLQGVSNNRHDYDKPIELPENKVFQQMAEREALGEQYDDLARRGYSRAQIANYIMKQKYLPLIRHATGKQNIIPTMKLTDENWKTIKAEMLKRQMRGLEKNLNRTNPDTGLSNARYNTADMTKEHENALARTMDAKIDALRKFQDPSKVKVDYSDKIKNNPVLMNAIMRTSNNVW